MTNPVSNAQLAQLVNDALAKWNTREAEHYAWVSGTATGGPNNDGRYPLSNGSGGSSLIDSPAKLANLLNGPAATAVSARDLALTYRDAAQASAAAAATDRGLANNHRLAAQDHKDLAKQYRDDTAALKAAVEVWKDQVSANATTVAANAALALGYRDDALAHRNAAQTARTAAEAAAALAATFNPNDYYTKVAADARYLQTTNFTWANLSGKPTTFTPAAHSHVIADVTGLQTALDGKAAASHTHTIAQVTGLQTALDGKQAAGSYAAAVHTHAIADITGLQAGLDAKLNLTGGSISGALTVTGNAAAGNIRVTSGNAVTGSGMWGTDSALAFSVGSTEYMRLATSGNLGIRTANPQALAHISFTPIATLPALGSGAGALALGPSANYGMLMGTISNGSGYIQQQRFDATATVYPILLQPQGGNVGIGTSSPTSRLVVSNAGAAGFEFDPAAGIVQTYNRSTSAYTDMQLYGLVHRFFTGASPTERVRIDASGNVGIGLLSPNAALHVRRTGSVVSAISTSSDGSVASPISASLSFRGGSTEAETARIESFNRFANLNQCDLLFSCRDSSGALTPRMIINDAGSVGIGTTSPSSGLDVNAISVWCGTKTANSGFGGNLRLRDDTGTFRYAVGILGGAAETAFSIFDNVAATVRLSVSSSGNIGIGTTSQNNRLQSTYAVPASVPSAGAGGHGLAVGSFGFGLATGALNSGDGYLQVTRWDAVAANYNLLLQPNGGNVGIGTSAPGGRLEVLNNGTALRLNTTFVGGNAVDINPFILGVSNGGYSVTVGGTIREVIDTSGNLGINTTAPTQRLDVNGNALIRGGDLFIRENPAGAGTGMRLHHNGSQAYIDYDGALNFRTGDGSLHASISSGTVLANNLNALVSVNAQGSGTGSVALSAGTASQPGYIQWNTADGTRRGYMGWSEGTNIVYQAENGWGLKINSVVSTSSNIIADGVISAKGGGVTAEHNGTFTTTVGIVQPGVDAMIQLGRVGNTPGTLPINNTANTTYIYSAGGLIRIGGAGNFITLNNGGASFTSTVNVDATTNLNSTVNIPGGNLRINSGGGDAAMGAYVGFRNNTNVERGWVGYGDGTSRMRLQNGIGDILVSANNNVELNGSVVRRFGAGAMIHHASATFNSGAITVSTASPSGGTDGDIWIRTAT